MPCAMTLNVPSARSSLPTGVERDLELRVKITHPGRPLLLIFDQELKHQIRGTDPRHGSDKPAVLIATYTKFLTDLLVDLLTCRSTEC